ncbi:peptidylprolyl isomerase [Clostridium sp. MSJ-4]|uniref:peptidylprolyl isomerase n=1 Tax=Clostridium simiarum TaxID=2841506 RepID=A0ABS6F3G7_9CLOT|nr:peptidylprolyl isomerase [Clostridium amazonitimonense]MBU5592102.1 peptidylprolyl isomerase [Clostridium simiarum]
MKNIKKIITATMIAAFTLTAAGCTMIEKTPEAMAKSAVAKVSGKKITRGDLDKKMAPYDDMVKQQFGEDYKNNQEAMDAVKNLRTQMVDQLVALEIFSKKGEELKIIPTGDEMNQEIDKRLADMKTMFGNDDTKFEEAMKQQGLTLDEIKEFIKEDTIMSKVQEYMIKDVKVEEAEAKDYYEKNKDALYTDKPGADVSHIVVKDEETANTIKAKIDKGEDFAALAKEYGTDGTKDQGGKLGFIEYDTQSYDPDFVAGFKNLKEGEVSSLVKTQWGYHLIKVTGIKTEATAKEFDKVKEDITNTLLQEKQKETFNKTLEDWKKEAKVKIYEDNI